MDTVAALQRTESAASVDSVDPVDSAEDITPSAINASRRTRKRFTNVQLTMLETLFHRNSHPSREEREAVAKAGQMYVPVPALPRSATLTGLFVIAGKLSR